MAIRQTGQMLDFISSPKHCGSCQVAVDIVYGGAFIWVAGCWLCC
jgi:hypothetical protein